MWPGRIYYDGVHRGLIHPHKFGKIIAVKFSNDLILLNKYIGENYGGD